MFYTESTVVNFGKYAHIRVKKIKQEESTTVYYYDTEKIDNLRTVLDSYMIMMINDGWKADFHYPVCVMIKGNETFTVRHLKQVNEVQFLIGGRNEKS